MRYFNGLLVVLAAWILIWNAFERLQAHRLRPYNYLVTYQAQHERGSATLSVGHRFLTCPHAMDRQSEITPIVELLAMVEGYPSSNVVILNWVELERGNNIINTNREAK